MLIVLKYLLSENVAIPSRVNPENVFESKIFPQSCVQYLDCNRHVPPALVADTGSAKQKGSYVLRLEINVYSKIIEGKDYRDVSKVVLPLLYPSMFTVTYEECIV